MSHQLKTNEHIVSAGGANHIASPNGRFHLVCQHDGNVVLYDGRNFSPDRAIWASNTYGKGSAPYRLIMQQDGHLVCYDAKNSPTWATGVYNKGHHGYVAVMQDDGNFVQYDGHNKPMWCSRTDGGQKSPHWGDGDKLM